MERYSVHDEYMTPSEHGNVVLYDDAQRALDAEREKVKALGSCEACWNLAWVLCRDDEPNAVPMKCANGTTYWRCDYCWYKQQLATLQAQLADRDAMILQMGEQAAVLAKENMAVKAQLRQVEGERDRLKGDMKERFKTIDQLDSDLTTLRQLVEAILLADERGQGLPFKEAMDAAAKAINWNSLPPPTEERHE